LFATLTVFAAALLHGNQALAFATLPLAAALLGFLCFNFNPATIFLGDGGSLLIGFLLGSYGAIWFQKSATLLGVTGPLLAFSIPLLDVLLCIVRRFLRNKPIFSADRGHIHHRLLERGLTPRRAVLVIYAVSGIAATLSLLQSFFPNVYAAAAVLLVAVGAIWAGVRFLGYAEFVFAGRILRTGGFQRLVTAQLELEELRTALAKVSGPDDCWTILRNWYRRLGFSAVTFQVWGAVYRAGDTPGPAAWSVRIPVGDAVIEFAQNASATTPVIVSSLVETFSAIAGKLTGAPVASPRSSIAAQVQG
jgi:UDP-GlcNAc:undecaprenyl-phosphate GlcNAc-1-phosphate transferase